MRVSFLQAVCVLVGAPLTFAIQTDGRDPGSIPKLDVPEPPSWEDIEHPEFEPYPVEQGLELQDGAILEQFTGTPSEIWERWHVSKAARNGDEQYTGEWAIEEARDIKGFANDLGLVLKSEQKVAAIARKLDPPLDVSSKPTSLVVQYEVKLQQQLRCGGAYLKLLPTTTEGDWSEFSNETPYLIMFGPDKCGTTDKVHFIIRRDGVEHHFAAPPRTRSGLLSTLYTLVINEDQTFEIRINGEIARAGSLRDSTEFEPPLVLPAEIDDPNDRKPDDWVEDEYIPDPNEPEKPEDWIEDGPHLIHDPNAEKPATWREDLPLFIPDPDAVKPEAWDDEEDGEWTAPEILNPECAELDAAGSGCGEWVAPLIRNPSFRGKWSQPLIPNPDYEGEWMPRKIANPDFHPEKEFPGQLEENIGGIGFELLTVQGDILFDNIYVGHSLRDAENIGNATWSPKYIHENEAVTRASEAHRKQAEDAARKLDEDQSLLDLYRREFEYFKLDPMGYSADTYNEFIDSFRADKVTGIKQFPVTAAVVSAIVCVISSVLFGIFNVILVTVTGRSIQNPPQPPRVSVTDVDGATTDKTVPSSAEDVKKEATKIKRTN